MDIPQFKDVIQKLGVFKRHSSLLVPVVIGLVGLLLFVPAQLISSKLRAEMLEESVTKRSRQISSLRQNTPASDQYKVEKERQQAYKNDANQILLLAKELTQRQLLSDKIFPEPRDKSILLFKEFGQWFRSGIDEQLKGLNAGECPTAAELKRSLGGVSGGSGRSSRSVRRALSGVSEEIRDALCRSKAESAYIYCNPSDLNGYEFWGDYKYAGTPEAIKDCWYYQLAYWIIEDIIDTIKVVNSGSNSVFESPVKRFLGVRFDRDVGRVYKAGKGTVVGQPIYVLTIYDGLAVPFTSRVCNDSIDVVHFNVRFILSSKAVLRFMQQLCSAKQHIIRESGGQVQGPRYAKHNQITVLESRLLSINRKGETHSLYRYGEDAVVELDLICEYVFSKKGYEEIKPISVKQSQIVPTTLMGYDSRGAPVAPVRRPVPR
jgi:hypothetical protein